MIKDNGKSKKANQDKEEKKPRDKSISLKPLNFKEALANLLGVKPKPQDPETPTQAEESKESDTK